MEPVFNQQYSDDSRRFVYQELGVVTVNYLAIPQKKFTVESSKKSKKDMKKEKKKEDSPWTPKLKKDKD